MARKQLAALGVVVTLTVLGAACTAVSSHPAAPERHTAPPLVGAIPALLNRSLHFPVLQPGQRCPASHGSSSMVTIGDNTGTEFGNGPVRVLIGASRHGVAVLLAHTSAPPWLGFKTAWFSVPGYEGPFVIRAKRLGHPGPVSLAGTPAAMAPLVVPRGPTIDTVPLGNGRPGYRSVQSVLWVRSPGCYAWQVDGLEFSEIIVVRAVLR